MYAIEFRARIKNGLIEVPQEHRDKLRDEVKVIILAEKTEPNANMIEELLTSPLKLPHFKPLSREEIYGRT